MTVPEMNRELRLKIRGKGVTMKEVAQAMDIHVQTLYYHLDRKMTDDKHKEINRAINKAYRMKYNES